MSDAEQMTEENVIKNETQECQEVRSEESQRENLAKNLYKDYQDDTSIQGSTKAQSTIKKEEQIEKREEKNIIQGHSDDSKMPLDPSYQNDINGYLAQPKELESNQKEMMQESHEDEIMDNHPENNNTSNLQNNNNDNNNGQLYQYQDMDFDLLQDSPKEDDDDVLRENNIHSINNNHNDNRSELVNYNPETQNRNEYSMLFDDFENNEIANNCDGLLNFYETTQHLTNGNNG